MNENLTNSEIVKVMRKIHVLYIARALVVPVALCAAAGVVIACTVSVPNVMHNLTMVADFGAVISYLIDSFAQTELYVQSALVAGALFLLLTARGTVRVITHSRFSSF